MSTLIYSLINLAYLTTGRRLYALKQCLEVATSRGLDALVALIRTAIGHDTNTVALEDAWARSKNISTARGKSLQIDNRIDAVLGTIYSILSENLRVFDAEHPLVISSTKIISQLLPEGVKPIITLPFEELITEESAA